MPDALAGAGVCVEPHGKHFRHDAPDTEWLSEVGRRGWVVLTKDKRIRYNPLEKQALLAAGVRAFFLTCGDMSGPDMAALFVRHLPAIERIARKAPGPVIALVSRSGVSVI